MFGELFRALVHGFVRIYYAHIEVSHQESIPAKGPVLFVANHPNSLIDPVVIGIAVRRPVHFLAKASLFTIPVFGSILRSVGMFPAYRKMDDPTQTAKNLDTLSGAAQALKNGETVGIFPEGKSHDLPQVDHVHSGAARMAMMAYTGGAKAIQVLPLGLNYEEKERFRSAIWVNVGEPIAVQAFAPAVPEEERKAVRRLTEAIDSALKQVTLHLEKPEWAHFLEHLEAFRPPPGPKKPSRVAVVQQRKRITDAMNYFLRATPDRAEAMAARLANYHEELRRERLDAHSPLLQRPGIGVFTALLWEMLVLVSWAPLALAGFFANAVPFALTRGLAHFLKAPGRSTIALSRLLPGLVLYFGWYGLLLTWITDYHGWVLASLVALCPLLGLIFFYYLWRAPKSVRIISQTVRFGGNPHRLASLRAEQDQLHNELDRMAAEFWAAWKPATVMVAHS